MRSLSTLALAPLLLLALVSGCNTDDTAAATQVPMGPLTGPFLAGSCDPLVPSRCGYPFPSNVWVVADPTTPTGLHVAFGPETLPKVLGKDPTSPTTFLSHDGFSPGQAPMTDMPGATIDGLPTQDDLDASLSDTSPTVLLDAETGERIPHFAELDMSAAASDGDRALMLRPVVRLKDAHRYVVAIRHVVGMDGVALPPSDGFRALRDGVTSADPDVESRRGLYNDIFTRLESAGVGRGDLQIAWDYTTASRESHTRMLLHMRDDALAKVGDEGPEYTIKSVEDAPNEHIAKRVILEMTVPLYLDKAQAGGNLVLGDDGLPKQNGTASFEVLVQIPNSVLVPGAPKAGLLQNAHGLLGRKTEGQNGYLAELSDLKGYVSFAVDLVGMAEEDENWVVQAIVGDIGKFDQLVGRQHQGILNSLLAMRMMKGRFWKDPLVQVNGESVIDPSQCYYRGDSQGGIFGATYMALSTDVTRGLLGEPGMPYNLLLNRSIDFDPFFAVLSGVYDGGRDTQLVLGLVQMLWDKTEPVGWAPFINADPLSGTPSHEILIEAAIGDYQVTPLGAHILARTVGAKNALDVNRSIWGIDEAKGPFEGSGILEFSFGLPESPKTNTPPQGPEDDDPHDKVRVLQASHDATDLFLRQGKVQSFCTGACDPE